MPRCLRHDKRLKILHLELFIKLSQKTKQRKMQNEMTKSTIHPEFVNLFNHVITTEELKASINCIKADKAVPEDLVCNDFSKSSVSSMLLAIQQL